MHAVVVEVKIESGRESEGIAYLHANALPATLDASAAVVYSNVEDPCRTGSRMRRVLMFVGLTGFVLATAVAAPVDAEPSPCPMGGGWELYTEDHPAVEATDRNGDGYVCARFYDNDRVPHRAVLTDNRA